MNINDDGSDSENEIPYDDMYPSSERLQTNLSFELDEQDAAHEQYQQQLKLMREQGLRLQDNYIPNQDDNEN